MAILTRSRKVPPPVVRVNRWTLRRIKRKIRDLGFSTRVVNRVRDALRRHIFNPYSTHWFLNGCVSRVLDKNDVNWFLWATCGDFDGSFDPPWYCENDYCGEGCYPDAECSCIVGEIAYEMWDSYYPEVDQCDCLTCPEHGKDIY